MIISKEQYNKLPGKYKEYFKEFRNDHPTVKSLRLLEYLCILTKTPTGGIVLDPFTGSGTTCMAAKKTGRNYIGIEMEEEYVKIAEARVNSIQRPLF
jgi:site-specific DNA-methyltransferase (adenine-specific)